jgi:RNA polymerase sigma factor (sigma-70 family)
LELLVEFRESGRQEPFEEIVRRYAAMVYGVCLRVTADKHDAEDATQAVFLSLALQTRTNREIRYLGPWLQRVAHRLALDVTKSRTRRKRREQKMGEHLRANGAGNGNGHVPDPASAPGNAETNALLMEELNSLPPKYRMPLVMHYFGGLSREQMARELGCNPSTLGVRVHRGRAMLAKRLAKRGLNISTSALPAMLEFTVRSTALGPLIHSAASASMGAALGAGASGSTNGAALASAKVIAIARTAARAVVFAKLKYAVALAIVTLGLAFSAGGAVSRLKQLDLRSILPNVGDWIRPLLRSFMPPLRAEAAPPHPPADDSVTSDSSHGGDLPITVDFRRLGLASADGIAPPPMRSQLDDPAGLAHPAPQESSAPAAPASPALPAVPAAPQLNSLAVAMLAPPLPAKLPASSKDDDAAARQSSNSASAKPDKDSALARANDSAQTTDSPQPIEVRADHLLIGAGGGGAGGPPETYTLPANVSLHARSETIGETGAGVFRQSGGFNSISAELLLGHRAGSSGRYEQLGGQVIASREIIGDEGEGTYVQFEGVNIATDQTIVGQPRDATTLAGSILRSANTQTTAGSETSASSSANHTRSASSHTSKSASGAFAKTRTDSRPTAATKSDAGAATGTSASDAAPAASDYDLTLGKTPTGKGEYNLAGGQLVAGTEAVGLEGSGVIIQSGGEHVTSVIDLGVGAHSKGLYRLEGGRLIFVSSESVPSPGIKIGGRGNGTFTLDGSTHSGAVIDPQDRADVVVRSRMSGSGTLVGAGKVGLGGVLVNNGQVIADGFKHNRVLDLTSFSRVASKIENPPQNGTSGWFARRRGALALPAVAVSAGTATYTWGEDDDDPMIDLVNSVRFQLDNAEHAGYANIALYATDSDIVPTLPDGHHFIGIWSFEAPDVGNFDGVDFTIRYDDALASSLGLDENILKLWHYDTMYGWQRIMDDSFSRDTIDHLISGHSDGRLSFFAVSAPEPGAGALMIAGAATFLAQRRRRGRR